MPECASQRSIISAWIFVLSGLAIVAFYLSSPIQITDLHHRFGDYASYWAAFHVLMQGENPYDPNAIRALLEPMGWSGMHLFHPPFVLILLAPLLAPPLHVGIALLLCCSILSFVWVVDLVASSSTNRSSFTSVLLTLATFLPGYLIFPTGQFALIQVAAIAGAMRLLELRHDRLAGLLLSLSLVKFHLVIPAAIGMLLWLVVTKRWTVIVYTLIGLAGAILTTVALNPDIWVLWATAPGVSGHDWVTAAPSSFARLVGQQLLVDFSWIPNVFISLGILTAIFIALQSSSSRDFRRFVGSLLIISLITTPYSWVSDLSLLLIPFTIMIAAGGILARCLVIAMLLATIAYTQFEYYYQSFWLAPMIGVFWVWYVVNAKSRVAKI